MEIHFNAVFLPRSRLVTQWRRNKRGAFRANALKTRCWQASEAPAGRFPVDATFRAARVHARAAVHGDNANYNYHD